MKNFTTEEHRGHREEAILYHFFSVRSVASVVNRNTEKP